MTYQPKAARAHVIYKNAAGKRLPGVTTIVGTRAKHLIRWALGLQAKGIDYDAYMADVANVGKCAHEMIIASLEGRPAETGEWSADQIKYATVCHDKMYDWATDPKIDLQMIASEVEMVSETMQVGGTMDIHATVTGRPGVFDIKTSDSGIYLDNWYQVAAYSAIAREIGREVEICGIIRASKEESQLLDVQIIAVDSDEFRTLLEGFQSLRWMYEDDKSLRKALGAR